MEVPQQYAFYFLFGLGALVGVSLMLARSDSLKSFGPWFLIFSGASTFIGATANALAGRLTVIDLAVLGLGLLVILGTARRIQDGADSFNRSVQNSSGGMD